MSLREVYHWFEEIWSRMPLGKWQALGLALFSLGVVLSERSTLSKIAEKLWFAGRADNLERRLQRWVANEGIEVGRCCEYWTRWVVSSVSGSAPLILLVDLTKISDRIDILMVGLAYRCRCIPLAWCCLPGNRPWPERQVILIRTLLQRVARGLPAGAIPLVEADRGIGNSSELMAVVTELGWHFMVRVNGTTTLRLSDGAVVTLASLVTRGKRWSGQGVVFPTSAYPTPAYIHLAWQRTMDQPWCLVTNAPHLCAHLYAQRSWQEQGFRDLKSGGWHWHYSQVRRLDHAERLILILALAYAWTLSLGTRAIRAGKALRRQLARGRRPRLSVFRLGLRYLYHLLRSHRSPPTSLFFRPALNSP